MVTMVYLDNSHFLISAKDAKSLCLNNRLPDHGREQLVAYDGKHWWLGRTIHERKMAWCIRDAGSWKTYQWEGDSVLILRIDADDGEHVEMGRYESIGTWTAYKFIEHFAHEESVRINGSVAPTRYERRRAADGNSRVVVRSMDVFNDKGELVATYTEDWSE